MSGTVEGLFLLFGLGMALWLAGRRFRVRASAGARTKVASMDTAASAESALLNRHGHAMQAWSASPALGGLVSRCTRCVGTCVITADEIIHNPPLIALDGELAACPARSPGQAARIARGAR